MNTLTDGAKHNQPPRAPGTPDGHPTIGLLCDFLTNAVTVAMWNGVHDAARQLGANLLYFGGGFLQDPRLPQANAIYDLVTPETVDGLVVWGAQLTHYASQEKLKAFCSQYHPLPIVNIGLAVEGIPSLLPDNHQGMRDVVAHLIEAHGCRRIACISGPDCIEWRERYRGYVDALVEHDIPLDPTLIVSWAAVLKQQQRDPGYVYTHADGIRALLDIQGLRPREDFEAIVGFNDDMCTAAVRELHARGLRVPDDVKVAGFDDTEEAQSITPPLTTVRQSFYNLGGRGVETLLALIRGQEVPEQVILPLPVIIRRSCGCISKSVLDAAAGSVSRAETGESVTKALTAQLQDLSLVMVEAAGNYTDQAPLPADIELAENLVKKFAAEMSGESPGAFLSAVEDVLRHVIASDENAGAWQGALSALRRHTQPYLQCEEDVSKAEDLWNQGRVAIGEVAQRGQTHRTFRSNRQAHLVHDISQVLSTTPDVDALGDVVVCQMPDLGIPSCYLSLYEDPSAPTGWSRLILAYDRANAQYPDARIALEPGGRRFPSQQLVPADLLPQNRQYSMVVLPLFFGEEQLGFVLFEAGPREGDVYQTLHMSLAGALHSARLLQQVTSRGLQLQTAAEVSQAATSILAPAELIQQIVDLACTRFDLYYVGLFLVDTDESDPAGGPAGRWAVLQAGTGEAGRKMLEQGYKLKVGGGSMIGRCVAEGRAIIALDVGKEAVHFGNPLLPATHSEVALPLTNRGEVIGALSIHSTQEAAFDEEDTAVFQTMANQLANAIANARLYDQAQQEIAERKQAEEALRQRTLELEAHNAEIDAFAHTVAHDLKSPLSAVILLSTMLEEQFEEMASEKVKDTLQRISQTGYRSANIIDELLLLSSVRKEDVQLEPLDMASIVAEAQERLVDMLAKYQAEVSRAAEWPVALGHARWVEEIWVNYINNAVKYGGRPEQGVPPRIELGFDAPSDAHVRFWVRDNGPGLALEEQARLFAPFTRLHQARAGGHGLGLSIVQRIAERLGGEVGVESEVGQGSVFYFTLPTTAQKVPGCPVQKPHLPLEAVAASASQLVDQAGHDGPVRPAWRR